MQARNPRPASRTARIETQMIECNRRRTSPSERLQDGWRPRYASATALKQAPVAIVWASSVRITATSAPATTVQIWLSLIVVVSPVVVTTPPEADTSTIAATSCRGTTTTSTARASVHQWRIVILMPTSRISPIPSGRSCGIAAASLIGRTRAGGERWSSRRSLPGPLGRRELLSARLAAVYATRVVSSSGDGQTSFTALPKSGAERAVERDPENPVARALLTAGRRVRSWTVFGRESLVAWTRASRDVARLRRESQSLRAERKRAVLTFGEAVYREDAAVVEATRARLREIDEGLESRERVRAAALANARHHVQEERVAVQPTRTFSVDELTSGGDPQK